MEIVDWKCILFIVSGNVICLRICFRKILELQKCNNGGGGGQTPFFFGNLVWQWKSIRKSFIIIITHQVNF
jgi:hypothetical protein